MFRSSRQARRPGGDRNRWGWHMLDIVFIALGAGFFLACVVYTYACDRL
jgi:hypothetical protein